VTPLPHSSWLPAILYPARVSQFFPFTYKLFCCLLYIWLRICQHITALPCRFLLLTCPHTLWWLLLLIVSLSYVLVVYRRAREGHSLFRLGLLCNPRTIKIPSELMLFVFKPLSPPYIVSSLALALQFASLLSDLTPVRVSFAIKSLATLVIRVDSRTRPTRSLRITLDQVFLNTKDWRRLPIEANKQY